MKILVFSDSHGDTEPMRRLIRRHSPDAVLHLGDHAADAEEIRLDFPETVFWTVRGNCDLASGVPLREELSLEGVHIFMTHGHAYQVKYGMDSFLNTALCSGAALALYGHTHVPDSQFIEGMWAINPGSIRYGGTYCLIEAEKGKFTFSLLRDGRE